MEMTQSPQGCSAQIVELRLVLQESSVPVAEWLTRVEQRSWQLVLTRVTPAAERQSEIVCVDAPIRILS